MKAIVSSLQTLQLYVVLELFFIISLKTLPKPFVSCGEERRGRVEK